jgi:hypothetical protein
VARIAPTLLVLALLAATAAAFVVTEALKLRPSPISAVSVDPKVVSPVAHTRTTIAFRLRARSRITVQIVRDDKVVRTLVHAQLRPRGRQVLTWNGLGDGGARLPDGPYAVRVEFAHGHLKRILMPNPLAVDTTPPVVSHPRIQPNVISPDGDGHSDRAHVTFQTNEPARGVLYVNGRFCEKNYFPRLQNGFEWNGCGGHAPVGIYHLSVAAIDPAKNLGKPVPAGTVVVRFVLLGRSRIAVAPGGRFQVAVSADHNPLRWFLGKRQGRFHGHVLRLVAPTQAGLYRLRVGYHGRYAVAKVLVR